MVRANKPIKSASRRRTMRARAITPTSCHGFYIRTPLKSLRSSFCGRQVIFTRLRTTGQHRTSRSVARPVRPALGELVAAKLVGVGTTQHLEQFVDARIIVLLGAVDRLLRQIV